MVKKFRYITEQVYRCSVEVSVDLDELRKEEKYKDMADIEILLNYAIEDRSGAFDGRNNWTLDESNVRTIYDENGNDVYID